MSTSKLLIILRYKPRHVAMKYCLKDHLNIKSHISCLCKDVGQKD